jgi:hypothetical protein
MSKEAPSVADASDRALGRALLADVKGRVPAWFDPRADQDLYDGIMRRQRARSAHRPDLWRWVAAAFATLLLGTTALSHTGLQSSNRSVADTALTAQLAQDTGAILNQPVPASAVALSLPGKNRAILTNVNPGRWRTINFDFTGGEWTPVSLTTVVAGITLTYEIATGPNDPGVLLPYSEQTVLERRLAQMPYSSRDTQAGALARLPINLSQATPEGAEQLGLAKLPLVVGKMTVLALTYEVRLSSGQVAYVPIGWYWWSGAPPVVTGQSPPG